MHENNNKIMKARRRRKEGKKTNTAFGKEVGRIDGNTYLVLVNEIHFCFAVVRHLFLNIESGNRAINLSCAHLRWPRPTHPTKILPTSEQDNKTKRHCPRQQNPPLDRFAIVFSRKAVIERERKKAKKKKKRRRRTAKTTISIRITEIIVIRLLKNHSDNSDESD